MRSDETNAQPERFVLMLLDQFDSLCGGLAVGMNQVIAVRFHHDKRVSTDGGFPAIRIILERLAIAGSFPFRAGTVEPFGPRCGIVRSVTAVFTDAAHANVINLADASGVVAIVFKVLSPRRPVADLRTRARVTKHSRCVWVVARHERRSRRPAVSSLAVSSRESSAPSGQTVDVRCIANLVSVARQCRRR